MTKIFKPLICFFLIFMLLNSICLAEQAQATLTINNITVRGPVQVELFLDPIPDAIIPAGTIIHISSKVSNVKDAKSITYYWYVDRNDGKGYILIDVAVNDYLEFAATRESLLWSFKLVVVVEW